LREATLDRPISAPGALFWTIVLLTVEHLCVELTEAARGAPLTDIVSLSACRVLATSIVLFAIVRTHAREVPLRRALGVAPLALHHAALSAAAGAGLAPVLSALDDRILARFPYNDPEMLASVEKLVSSASSIVLVVGMFLVIPVASEVFYRGLLFGGLRGAGNTRQAVLVTALLYALSSLDLRVLPSALLLGIALGWLRARSGSVFSPIVAVLAFHGVDTVTILRGGDPLGDVSYLVKWIVVGAVLALLSLVAMRPRRSTTPATPGASSI
jgi:membrane protease YdiL (CAAX protease family)